jgi:hypothetical protein
MDLAFAIGLIAAFGVLVLALRYANRHHLNR